MNTRLHVGTSNLVGFQCWMLPYVLSWPAVYSPLYDRPGIFEASKMCCGLGGGKVPKRCTRATGGKTTQSSLCDSVIERAPQIGRTCTTCQIKLSASDCIDAHPRCAWIITGNDDMCNGIYDHDGFRASTSCCACGGGSQKWECTKEEPKSRRSRRTTTTGGNNEMEVRTMEVLSTAKPEPDSGLPEAFPPLPGVDAGTVPEESKHLRG
jgi:hypothetical protein